MQPIEFDGKPPRPIRPPGPDIGDLPPDPDVEVPVQIPSAGRLLAAHVVDGLIVLSFALFVLALEAAVTGASFRTASAGWPDRVAEWLSLHSQIVVHALGVAIVFAGTYSAASTLRSGQTFGRRVTNTVLVRRNGQPFTLQVAITRALAGIVSTACLGAGFLWAAVDPYHRTWHDLFAGTVTVRRYVRLSAPS